MTAPGSVLTQLRAAIAAGNLSMVRTLAREFEASTGGRPMPLESAVTTLLLIRARRVELYPRAAAMLLRRLLDEVPGLVLADAALLVDALEQIEVGHLVAAERDLREVLAPRGADRLVGALRSPPRGSPTAWRWTPAN